jgi:alpha-tubulin suppressor-like RCC1 family protein
MRALVLSGGRLLWVALLVLLVLAGVVPASASESSGAAAWGLNTDGQLGNDTTTTEKEAVPVKVLTEATAIAGGELHSLALLKTGKVMAWGDNVDGQLGNGTITTEKEPVEVKGISEAVAIAAGADHSLALLKSGKVMSWGLNTDGQLGNGTTTTEKEPVEVKGISEAVAIAAGADFSLAVLKSGKVVAWGENNDGQLGNDTTTTEKEPVEVKGISEASAVAGGEFHSLALLKSGKIKAWGENNDGQLGNDTTTTEKEPVEVKGISEAAGVSAGHNHTLAVLKSGKVDAWGDNNDGQLGNGTTTTEKEPVEVKGITEASAVVGGEFHSVVLLKSGKVDAWGENNGGQLGNGTTTTEKEPVEAKGLSGVVGDVATGANFSLASYASKPANTKLPTISGEAKDEKTLTASAGTWTGSPTITYSYQWEACNTAGESCTNISGATSSTYTVAHAQVGDTMRVKETARNSAGEASVSSAATATVAASAPANAVLPAIAGEAKDEKTLTASAGTWTGSPTITYAYQWESCNTAGESCTNISGATSSTYTVAHEQVGHTLRVKVTAKNTAGEASASSAQTGTVAVSAPANGVLPAIAGEAKDEKTLTASAGTWTGSPTITYSYQWEACNTAGESCTNISGATSSTYTIAHAQVADTIRVKLTATNSAGEASASSAQTGTVVASAPANTVLPTISGEAKDEKTLTSAAGTWSGSPTITYSYQWESCNTAGEGCASISGATSSTYTIAHAQVGDTIRVKVTAKSSAGEASASSAQTGTVVALVPANTVLPTISGEAKDEKTLTSAAGTWSGSPTITYAYQWESCNAAGESCTNISGATSATLAVGHGDVGGTLRVVVTATNSAGSTSKSSEASAAVAPSPPANTAPPAIAGTAKEGQTLSATPGAWSGSEPVEYTNYVWQRCKGGSCQPISEASGATDTSYVLAAGDVGSTIEVTVTAKNSAGEASATSQPTAEVAAVAPQNTAPPAIVGEAQSGETLTASTGTWSGTTPLTYSYLWEECNRHGQECQGIASGMSNSYTLTPSNLGHTIRVTVTAENLAGNATSSSETTDSVLEAGCTDGWAGPSEGAWETPGNWSTGKVPGAADTVCIPAEATVQISGEVTRRAGVINSEGTLEISGGTLELTRSSATSKVVSMIVQNRGVLAGSGNLNISGSLSWTDGTMSGDGTTVLASGADATVASTSLAERRFTNEGTVELAGTFGGGYPASGTFINKGTVEKTEGVGIDAIQAPFDNEGTVTVSSGTLELDGGGESSERVGTWMAGAGAGIVFSNAEYRLGATTNVTGALTISNRARVHVGQIEGPNAQVTVTANPYYSEDNGLLDLEGPATSTIGTLDVLGVRGFEFISTAEVTGAGDVEISRSFDLGNFAYMEGAGTTTIMPGASGVVSGSLSLQQRTLTNAGTLTIEEGAELGGSESYLDNTGTIVKAHGEGSARISDRIDNEGLVKATAGTLELSGGGSAGTSATGAWQGAEGAKILFNSTSGPFDLGSSVSMSGSIEVAEGTVTVRQLNGSSATVTVAGADQWHPGTLELTGVGASTLQGLTLAGGALAGPAQLNVTSAFVAASSAHLEGAGSTVIEPGATGSIGYVVDLEERTLENAGTLTIGEHDRLNGSKRARVVNSGTLNLNANSPIGSEYGLVSVPGEATLVNTGVVQKVEGGEPALCSFAVDNDGTITAVSGTLEFTSGGESAAFASDTWAAAPGTAIELNGISSGVEYSLGTSATITGAMHLDANVTAGAIEGSGALTTLHSILTLTGYTPSELSSLTFLQAPPDVWFPQVQHLSVASELDIDNSLTWSSISAVFEGPGAIVTKPGSTTLFDAGSATFDGGQLINEGTATWETGQLDDEIDYGTFFVNLGTFHADAQEFEPPVQGCRVYSEGSRCPVFENDGIFTADLPHVAQGDLPVWPHIAWAVDIVNNGELEVPYRQEYVCPELPPYGWTSEACVAEQQKIRETYVGLLLKDGATVFEPVWYVNPPTIEGFAEEGETLKVTPVTWRAPHVTSTSYQWQRCNAEEGPIAEEEWVTQPPLRECSDVPSADESSYVITAADVGYRLRAVVTAHTDVRSEAVDSEATNAVWPFELFGEEGEEEAAEESTEGEGEAEGSSMEEFVAEEGNPGAVMLAQPALTPAFAPESLAGDLHEPVGYIHYTTAHPRYNKIAFDEETGLPDGEWTNEARFTPKSTPAELSWLFNLSPRVQQQAIGTVTEKGTVYKLPSKKVFNYSDFHPGVLPNYNFHSRIHVYLGQEYQLELKFEYPCVKDEEEGLCIQYSKHNFKLDK